MLNASINELQNKKKVDMILANDYFTLNELHEETGISTAMKKYVIVTKTFDTVKSYHYGIENIFDTYIESMNYIFKQIYDKYLVNDAKKIELIYEKDTIIIANRNRAFRDEYLKCYIIVPILTDSTLADIKMQNFVINYNYGILIYQYALDEDIYGNLLSYFQTEYGLTADNNGENGQYKLKCDKTRIMQSKHFIIYDKMNNEIAEEMTICLYSPSWI